MQDVNSHGRAQRSAKSINLEANILSEWSASSTVLHRQIKDRIIALGAIIVVAAVLLPFLSSTTGAAERRAAAAQVRNAKDVQAFTTQDNLSKAARPHEQESERLKDSRASVSTLLGNLRLVIDAVPNTVAFDTVQAEVADAQLIITCKSQAETSGAGQEFVDAASQGPNVKYAVQASTMKSPVLGKDGVAFDFIKKIDLEP